MECNYCDGPRIWYFISSVIVGDDYFVSIDIIVHIHSLVIVQRFSYRQLNNQFLNELFYHFRIVTVFAVVAVLVVGGHFKLIEYLGNHHKLNTVISIHFGLVQLSSNIHQLVDRFNTVV
ncbi:hypothetical protein PG996_012935 [Apiospora saccharicola]|uniref:Uncharacterized protein n=1 Tax=Apiospora saccharicola TaxID=335842 RepID=A0ABR1U429_9PEZI